jgi:hypothetical protein
MLTSRRLLSGPRRRASSEVGSARGGRVGGKARDLEAMGLVRRDKGAVRRALSSGE